MKKLTLIILAVALAATAANGDEYYLCFTGAGNRLYIAEIPGPGIHDGFNIVHSFSIPGNSDALTYDGEHWWMYYQGDIYCFDNNGDYVSSFPRPYNRYVPGLGWDGQYLWIDCFYVWQMDIYGNPGPYGYFYPYGANYDSLTVNYDAERIIMGNDSISGEDYLTLRIYDYAGNYLFNVLEYFGHGGGGNEESFGALTYHDGIVWVGYGFWDHETQETISETYGYEYVEGEEWDRITTIENDSAWDLAICDENFLNIAETSLGKIKAYFATEEMKKK